MPLKTVAVLAFALMASSPAARAATCAPAASATADIAAVMTAMYAAAKVDDLDGFHAVTTPDFYAFDGGRRFDGDALMQLMKATHAAGTRLDWSVTEPKVEVACTLASITYVNVGSVTMNGATQPMTWLESAVLRYDGARWRIHFFSSTRAPQPK